MPRRTLALAAVLVILVAACGRGDDGGTAAPTTAGGATTAPGTGLDAGQFGDLGTVCSGGDTRPVEGQTGIDGTTIRLGVFSDVGFAARPGLDAEFNDTAKAFTSWCNEHGGIRGYKLEWDMLDAKFTEHQARILDACDRDFALVGGGAALDSSGQAARLACGLPDFPGYVVTDEAVNSDLLVPAVPNGGGTWAAGDFRWLGDTFPDSTQHVATLYGDYATTKTVNDRNAEVMDSLGWKVVLQRSYNVLGESNWTPFAQAMQEAGVRGVVYVGEPANLAAFEKAAANIDFLPDWIRIDANGYDTSFLKAGGKATDGTYMRSIFWPVERAAENPATEGYLTILKRYVPKAKTALLGLQGLSAWLLFSQSLGECIDKGDVTRDCVYSAGHAVTKWTGGGLHAPTNPRSQEFSECYAVIEARGGAFRLAKIDVNFGDIYNCDRGNVIHLKNSGAAVGVRCPSGVKDPLPSTCAKA
jgi:hypothetical protein